MDIYDQILENLELERELGTRTVEIDRALLVPPKPEPPPEAPSAPKIGSAPPSLSVPAGKPADASLPAVGCDILFLSGRPLSEAGMEAIRKTVAAMKKIKPDVTIRLNEEGAAKVFILLGSDALKKRQTGAARPVRGRWMTVDGVPAMPTFSPDYIFSHFQEGSPGMVAAKRDMWNDIKAALVRL